MPINDDQWVKDLLNGLAKPAPISELEIKRFERVIDGQVADLKKARQRKAFSQKLMAAASVVVMIAGFAVFVNNENILSPKKSSEVEIALPNTTPSPRTQSEEPTPEESKASPQQASTPKPIKTKSSSDTQIYKNPASAEPLIDKLGVPLFESGLDYDSDFLKARSLVKVIKKPSSLKNLTSQEISCSVQLGIAEKLFALDKALYKGETISAYYFGESFSDVKVMIVGYGCTKIIELSE